MQYSHVDWMTMILFLVSTTFDANMIWLLIIVFAIDAGSNGSEFRGVSAGQHVIEVEKIDSTDSTVTSVTFNVPARVVSFTNFQGM